MVVYFKNSQEHTNTLCAQNINLLALSPLLCIIITCIGRLDQNTTYHGSCVSVFCPSVFTYTLTHINHGSIFIFFNTEARIHAPSKKSNFFLNYTEVNPTKDIRPIGSVM